MKHHFAHLQYVNVKVGDTVSKGQRIGTLGKSGTSSAHLHYEVQREFRGWTTYTWGLSKSQVLYYYKNPKEYDWRLITKFTHFGWNWLSNIGGGQLHPGIDMNGGVGNSDLGQIVRSPVFGKVIFVRYDSGWGNHLFIEESEAVVDNKLTQDQARYIYQKVLLREPENSGVIQNRHFDEMLAGAEKEIRQRFVERSELIACQSRISKLDGRISDVEEALTKAKSASATCSTKLKKANGKIETYEKDITDYKEIIKGYEELAKVKSESLLARIVRFCKGILGRFNKK